MRPFADPSTKHPIRLKDGTPYPGTVFLSAVIDHPRMQVGDYTYASDFDPPEDWAARLAPYLFYPWAPERLVIGKFCQIAQGVRFITSSANHRYDGATTYPFAVFGGPREERPSMQTRAADTSIGHDVWFGDGATVMPGTRIGSGVIVGARAVVSGEIPDYAIVAGNPAKVVRMRFPSDRIEALLEMAWWDWPIERILAHEEALCATDASAVTPG